MHALFLSRAVALSLMLCGTLLQAAPKPGIEGIDFQVAPEGDDGNDGLGKPVKTLHRAQAIVREWLKKPASPGGTSLTIVVHPGFYPLDKPLVFTDEDRPGRGYDVTWRHVRKKPPVISGGRKLGAWRVEGKVWKIDIPEAKEGQWAFRDLYVNGQRRVRARTPNEGYLRVEKAGADRRTSFTFKAGDVQPIANASAAELVFLHDWSISRIPLKAIDEAANTLTVAHPIGNAAPHYAIDNFEPHPRYFLENAPEYLDAPGEWHLDTAAGVLSYLPLADEKLDTAEAIAPRLESLIEARFTPQTPADQHAGYIHFMGLTFAHTAWPLPAGGYAGSQASFHEDRRQHKEGAPRNMAPAAVTIDGGHQFRFQQCTFTHLGASGLYYRRQCSESRALMCEFTDIGANGVMIGETFTREATGPDGKQQSDVTNRIGVETCRIEQCGQTDFGAVGVWVGIAAQTSVTNNDIAQLPYTGVSVGWKWDPSPTGCEGNVISANHIHHVLQKMSDGGGIYTLGRQPGTRLVGNHIHDVPVNLGRAESNGLFLDEGTSEIVVENNVIHAIEKSPIRFHRAERVTVINNWLINSKGVPTFRYNSASEESMTIRGNHTIEADAWVPPTDSPAGKAGIRADIAKYIGAEG